MNNATPYRPLCPLRLAWRSLWLNEKDNWEENMTRNNLKADLMYLRAGDRNRAIGVITNRTWNYWTASGHNCGVAPINSDGNTEAEKKIYQTYVSVSHDNGNNKLKVMGMKAKKYVIYYYNAEQPLLPIDIQIEWGPKLNLEYPDLTSTQPFVLFKAVTLDELNNGGTINPGLAPNTEGILASQSLKRDSLEPINKAPTVSNDSISDNREEKIKLYPNPASKQINIELPNIENNYCLSILNNSSQLILSDVHLKELSNEIDISRLSKGVYQVIITSKNAITHLKLVVE